MKEKANTKIGGVLPGGIALRGLSGGQKRRVTIGCGLVAQPSILLLGNNHSYEQYHKATHDHFMTPSTRLDHATTDEPTSGLDANSSLVVMSAMARLAKQANMAILCTIHQPRPGMRSFKA